MTDVDLINAWESFLQTRSWPVDSPPREVMAAMYRLHGPEHMRRIGLGSFKPDAPEVSQTAAGGSQALT